MFNLYIFSSTAAQLAQTRVVDSWAWYIIRAAGFTAAGLIVLLVLSGIGQVTGLTYKYIEPLKAWAIHKALALALCAAVVIHVLFLLVDHYVKFSVPQILIPFVSKYSNNTSFLGIALGWAAIAMGILAAYGIIILVASSLGWIETKKKTWRKLHYISYAVAVLVFLHALYSGSDLKYGLFRKVWILIGIVVVIGIVMRITRSKTIDRE